MQCSGDEVSRSFLSSANPRSGREDRRPPRGGGGFGAKDYGAKDYAARDSGAGGYGGYERKSRGANCVKVQGIPYSTSEIDLSSFFSDYKVHECCVCGGVGTRTFFLFFFFCLEGN